AVVVTPRQPDESVNVSDTHPLAEAGVLLAGTAALFAVVTLIAVFAINILLGLVSPATEVRWLSGWEPGFEVEDSSEREAVQALLDRLARHWQTDYTFSVQIMPESDPNALALPGGYIYVTRGLLDQVESENELAFVLAHELGHYEGRDHIRQLGRAAVIGLFFAAASGSGAKNTGFVTDLTLRNFSRAQETAADAFGLSLVQAEYGHVADADQFFTKIADGDNTMLDSYAGTHPAPASRITALRALAQQSGWSLTGTTTPWAPSDFQSETNP
ncbi:MAG: M48 family metallopeptidase, partial [Pseudomonadota bacterium]